MEPTVWTIGHSTRPIGEFLDLLSECGIEAIADVRRYPGSRHQRQYARDTFSRTIEETGRVYCWLPSLGGRRRPAPDSPSTAWRSAAFRGYADYLATEEFAAGLMELTMLAGGLRTAIMCAEAVWWRCHRSLIADVLKSLGYRVMHILGKGSVKEHPYTPPARIVGGRLTYRSG
jgi:uncharacterized protein (DUF488 family)